MTSSSAPAASAGTSPFRSNRSTPEERLEKRNALLLAAVRMFNERGFHATSLDDVAASLGVTKPVIYHYLGNKEQVLFECVRIGLADLQSAAAATRSGTGSGLDRLKAFLRRYAEIIMGDFGRCAIRTGDELLSHEARLEFRALKRQVDTALRQMIREAAADGSAQVGDVRTTAFALAGALNWPARWYRADGPDSAAAIAHRLVESLCAGLVPKTG
ncbi:TetR/AcrR family transcriptional regulator [Sandaracinobacter sp. RS1-74]|uniref:TetR/AcrR family transcriptional regulator n=1 Tax=Sandaracinobacteroides sayramensis TaxID=2913411 RepID=UPI001ED9D38A|nr:TetR/AcrR family transcriptional regulator [Sandaracinobacteroides sayramensis]MCG2842031.1 TetR/AcrR family transcriptional regulator [Sandaracinobacteroides sayramensis]